MNEIHEDWVNWHDYLPEKEANDFNFGSTVNDRHHGAI